MTSRHDDAKWAARIPAVVNHRTIRGQVVLNIVGGPVALERGD